jgi:hypothetical protein
MEPVSEIPTTAPTVEPVEEKVETIIAQLPSLDSPENREECNQ